MILLNHGVFSFGNEAKQSYDRMIDIVTKAEQYLMKEKVWRNYKKSTSYYSGQRQTHTGI